MAGNRGQRAWSRGRGAGGEGRWENEKMGRWEDEKVGR